jgi:hypothetical protein
MRARPVAPTVENAPFVRQVGDHRPCGEVEPLKRAKRSESGSGGGPARHDLCPPPEMLPLRSSISIPAFAGTGSPTRRRWAAYCNLGPSAELQRFSMMAGLPFRSMMPFLMKTDPSPWTLEIVWIVVRVLRMTNSLLVWSP